MVITYASEPDLDVDEFIDILKRSTLAERRPIDDRCRMTGGYGLDAVRVLPGITRGSGTAYGSDQRAGRGWASGETVAAGC